jgi:uncharacterized membrane protein YedE/YeeE
MTRALIALLSGALFGAGLAFSGMADPARVQGFLNLLGAWDPTLAFVMGVLIIILALLEIPRLTTTHWVIWGVGLIALAVWWLRLLVRALRVPASLVIIDLQDGDERIVRTKAAAAEELCGAINEARAEVVAGQG